MKQFWSIVLLVVYFSSCAQRPVNLSKVKKEFFYRFELPGTMLVKSVTLEEGGRFVYKSVDDKATLFAVGKWTQTGDTLILSNSINKNDFPIEISTDSSLNADSLKINWVRNKLGDILEDALVYLNHDTTKSCMPAFDECRFVDKKISSLKVVFSQGESQWVRFRPVSSGSINIAIPLEIDFNTYIFNRCFKFLVKKNSIYELSEDPTGNEIKKYRYQLVLE